MADENKTADGQETQEPTPAEKALQEQLQTMTQKMDQVTQSLQNPEIQRVLEMQKEGKQVQISEPEPPAEQPDVLESLLQGMQTDETDTSEEKPAPSPQEQLQMTDQLVKERAKELLKPLTAEIESLKQQRDAEREEAQQQVLASDIQAVSEKYEDFTEFKDEMAQQYAKTPNLTVEQYYILAKHSKLGDEMFRPYPQEETEYPLQITANRETARPKEVRHGPEGFRSMLNDAAGKRPWGRGVRY